MSDTTHNKDGSAAIVKATEAALIPITSETVKRYISRKANDQEIALFLNQCAMFQLNPFKREIYLVKYKDTDPATFITSYEVYLKRAERTGKWAGLKTGHEEGPNEIPTKAWAEIYRKDWAQPLYHEVFYREYVQTAKDQNGKPYVTRFWREKPITMLKKVAVAQALRMAFPDEFGGLPYIEEEITDTTDRSERSEAQEKLEAAQKEAYEASKKKPLPRIRDEFDPKAPAPAAELKPAGGSQLQAGAPDPTVDLYADAAEAAGEAPKRPAGATLQQLEKFGRIKADLAQLEVNETTLWKGIHRFSLETLKMAALELTDFDEPQIELVLGYLHRWKKALEKQVEDEKKKAAAAKGGAK